MIQMLHTAHIPNALLTLAILIFVPGFPSDAASAPETDPALVKDTHIVAANQVGFQTGLAKRFSAPVSPDGARFLVRVVDDREVVHGGVIRGGIGDFSSFRPADSPRHYLIEVEGGPLGPGKGDPFLIRRNLYQEQFWQPAVDFLIDTRSVVGTHPSAFGGCPWRDGNYYDAVLPALVKFYLADPARIEGMPRQIDWAADRERVLAPDFRFDAKNPGSAGIMDAVRRYYQVIEPPAADAPDVIKLIHWGAGFYLMKPDSQEPMADPIPGRIHPQTVEQMAYVVWAWPALRQWLSDSFYELCRDFCFAHWEPSLGISEWWDPSGYEDPPKGENPMGGRLHPYKGRHAPGHSIVPNLLMHEVARREGRDDAERYLGAAIEQAKFIIERLDWEDPRTTKGHRMSEHRTIPNLVWLMKCYPEQAPQGLREKIDEWAAVAIRRSDNRWDFRRYDDEDHWTIPKLNDVGNWASFPAVALAAASVVADAGVRSRLEQLAVSHIDCMFGRNPRLAAAPHQPEMGFPEVERGWPVGHKHDVCARLELCRGSFSSGPGSEMFPFQPAARYRHLEGWVNYGAAWCISLASLQSGPVATLPER